MRTIDPNTIYKQINRCYMEYDPVWPHSSDMSRRMVSFISYLERTAGITVDISAHHDNQGRNGWEVVGVRVINDSRFTMWLLKWT